MAQLIVKTAVVGSERAYPLKKRVHAVGSGADCDIRLDGEPLWFSLSVTASGVELLPAGPKVFVNGVWVRRPLKLKSCDRIEWAQGLASFVESEFAFAGTHLRSGSADVALSTQQGVHLPAQKSGAEHGHAAVEILETLLSVSQAVLDLGGVVPAMNRILETLVELSGAERGQILLSDQRTLKWNVIAGKGDTARSILSGTLLNETLKRREVVFIENMIGHEWADQESVFLSKIFSVACLPLLLEGQVLGAVILSSHSAGRVINRAVLRELQLLATQVALMAQRTVSTAESQSGSLSGSLHARELRGGFEQSEHANKPDFAASKNSAGSKNGDSKNTEHGRTRPPVIAQGSPLTALADKVQKLAPSELSLLLRGETGTGKEWWARRIHEQSARKNGPFLAVNCAAIPHALLESILFGHKKGAFTGADRDQEGKLVLASGGTFFLDEIGDMPLELQAKILRVIQERKVEPVGASVNIPIDVRFLSATHQDLSVLIKAQKFRQDLYYRLAGAELFIAPLRERKQDLEGLALECLAKSGKSLSQAALDSLAQYAWPGNIRELAQVLERAAWLCEGSEIDAKDLELGAQGIVKSEASWDWATEMGTLSEAQSVFTQQYVQKTLDQVGGNRLQAAKKLGVSERTLYRVLTDLS